MGPFPGGQNLPESDPVFYTISLYLSFEHVSETGHFLFLSYRARIRDSTVCSEVSRHSTRSNPDTESDQSRIVLLGRLTRDVENWWFLDGPFSCNLTRYTETHSFRFQVRSVKVTNPHARSLNHQLADLGGRSEQ